MSSYCSLDMLRTSLGHADFSSEAFENLFQGGHTVACLSHNLLRASLLACPIGSLSNPQMDHLNAGVKLPCVLWATSTGQLDLLPFKSQGQSWPMLLFLQRVWPILSAYRIIIFVCTCWQYVIFSKPPHPTATLTRIKHHYRRWMNKCHIVANMLPC